MLWPLIFVSPYLPVSYWLPKSSKTYNSPKALRSMAKFEINWLEDRSDESVLEEIRRVASLAQGGRLTRRVFNSLARIKSSAVERRFGSWAEATRRAGLSDALPVYSEDQMLADIRRVSDLCHNEPFTIAEYSKHGKYSGSKIKRQFGGWHKALNRAGIGERYIGPPVTENMKEQSGRGRSDEDLLGEIRAVAAKRGKVQLSGAEIEANSEINQSQLYRRFGSISKALELAGVAPARRTHTDDDVFENLLKVWTHYGRPPKVTEMKRAPSTVGPDAYLGRFGSWRGALKAFVERANSDIEDDTAPNSYDGPSPQADSDSPTQSPTVNVNDTHAQTSAKPSAVKSRRVRSSNASPEDRREAGLGLKWRVHKRDKFKCVLCGNNPPIDPRCVLHLDHVIPWSKGGKTREDNLRTLCSDCNIARSNRYDD